MTARPGKTVRDPVDRAITRRRWARTLVSTVLLSAAGACGGILIAVLLLGAVPGDSGDLAGVAGTVASAGAVVNYVGLALVTLAGTALVVVGWGLPGWRREVLLLVPLTWLVSVTLWMTAFLVGFQAID